MMLPSSGQVLLDLWLRSTLPLPARIPSFWRSTGPSGSPVQCAGLLGIKALEASELPPGSYMARPFFGARIFAPGGASLSFRARSIKAWAVERRLFDREMAAMAVRSGAQLLLNSPVTRLKFDGDRNLITVGRGHDKMEISAAVVISAEGVKARIARLRGLPSPALILSGAQAEVPFAVEDPEKVELHLGCAPGLFAWVIPTSERSARVGLCSEESACPRLRAFLASRRSARGYWALLWSSCSEACR